MQLDDSTRRQLRFSLVLQSAAGAMLIIALAVRIPSIGIDLVTGILLLGLALVVAAWTWTWRTLRRSRPETDA